MSKKNLFKAAVMTVAAMAAASLTGCGSVSNTLSRQEIASCAAQSAEYDKSHSFAYNITKVMGLESNFKDAYVDEAEMNKMESASKTGWYAGATLLTGNPFDLGSMLFLLAPTADNKLEKPMFVGYYPKDKAADAGTAFRAFEAQILSAFKAAASDLGFKQTDDAYMLTFKRESTSGKIQVKMGFGPGKTLVSAIETTTPAWISPEQEAAWGIGTSPALTLGMSEFKVYDGGLFEMEKSRKLRGELMEQVAKHLPSKAYMYVPSMRNEKGDRTPAYVADNQKKHLFVMPKSALTK